MCTATLKLYWFDLLLTYCTNKFTTNPQQIEQMEFEPSACHGKIFLGPELCMQKWIMWTLSCLLEVCHLLPLCYSYFHPLRQCERHNQSMECILLTIQLLCVYLVPFSSYNQLLVKVNTKTHIYIAAPAPAPSQYTAWCTYIFMRL